MAQESSNAKCLEKAYNSPQNKAIAQSFRFLRNKPTIIAFKTPSLEAYESSKIKTDKGIFIKMYIFIDIFFNFAFLLRW